MFIVTVVNNINSREFSASFDTETEANDWIGEQAARESWGRNARTVIKGQGEYDQSLVMAEVAHVATEDDPAWVEVFLDKEYSYTKTEVLITSSTPEGKKLRRDKLLLDSMEAKMFLDFGQLILGAFTKNVKDRGLTPLQKDELQADPIMLTVMGHISFGRISRARQAVDSVIADEVLFFQEDIDNIKLLMDDFLEDYPTT